MDQWKAKYEALFNQYEEDKLNWEEERISFQNEIEGLKSENKKYLDMIIKHSKNQTDLAIKSESPRPTSAKKSSNRQSSPKGQSDSNKKSQLINLPNQSQNVGPTNIRILTLKQLKDLFEDIYVQKAKFDSRVAEGKVTRETMEQFMYTYLNTRYGLKNLIVEWACSIVNGIKKFAQKDNDVALFGLVLRNECDEDFKLVQNQVKSTIKELLKMYLKGKYPLKDNTVVNKMFEERLTNGNVSEDECTDIVKYMYNESDSEEIIKKLSTMYFVVDEKSYPKLKEDATERDRSRNRLQFSMFEKIILDFQLKNHQQFLAKFISLFRSCDSDANGIISASEFREVVKKMDSNRYYKLDADKLLESIDPFETNVITFTSVISLFSSETVPNDPKQKSLLQLINEMF